MGPRGRGKQDEVVGHTEAVVAARFAGLEYIALVPGAVDHPG